MRTVARPPRRARARRHRSWLAAVAVIACLASACGFGHGSDFAIGFRRVALDLSYKDESLAKPAAPQQIASPQSLPAIPPFVAFQPPLSRVPQRSFPELPQKDPFACPAAGSDEHPEQPVTVFATTPPKAGTYLLHNDGKVQLNALATFQMPKHSTIQIANVARSQTNDPADPNGPTDIITWDVIQPGLSGQTITTYRSTFSPSPVVSTVEQAASQAHAPSGELDLVHLVIRSGDTTVDFLPTPPVTLMAFKNGQGTSWTSAGIDQRDGPDQGTSMAVQGSITKRTNVDLCGKVYDTYEVVSNEHIANLRTGLTSNTDPNDPNIYDVATQYGGLFVHQHVTTTTTFPTQTGAVTIVSNYNQTFDSITPLG